MRRTVWQAVVITLVAACGGADSGGPGVNPVLTIGKTATANGDNQVATVATALPNNLRVQVTDDGDPVEGEVVTWSTADGTVSPLQSTTDQNGVATTLWTLGTDAGVQNVSAALAGAVGSPVTFAAIGNPGPVAGIGPNSGNGQFAVVSTPFAASLAVRASDLFGNGVTGVAVDWVVTSGPVTLQAATSTTTGSGIATMPVTALGTTGPAVVTASVAGIAGGVDFDLGVVPAARQVQVGNGLSNVFISSTNGSSPAVDTVVVGQQLRWNLSSGTHNVSSTGTPSFTNSPSPLGASYTVQFTVAGTYQYQCSLHGPSMSGSVVVQ